MRQARMDFEERPRPEPPGGGRYPLPAGSVPFSNPTTSKAAADAARPFAGRLAAEVLEFVRGKGGATCDEVEQEMGLVHQTASARIRELALRGEIEDSGRKRPTRSQRMAIVWQAVE